MERRLVKSILYPCLLAVAAWSAISCLAKTELRTCIDATGAVQPDQVCIRGTAGNRWVYGGLPDPDRPGQLKGFQEHPSPGANVVSADGIPR